MSFMQKQITEKMKWLVIDGEVGTECVPLANTGLTETEVAEMIESADFTAIDNYYSAGFEAITSIEVVEGYGCRMQAPGYMDCTDWTVFNSIEECDKHLDEMYGDEE